MPFKMAVLNLFFREEFQMDQMHTSEAHKMVSNSTQRLLFDDELKKINDLMPLQTLSSRNFIYS